MGIADFITLLNGLFGSLAIFFLILAVDDMKGAYNNLKTDYIWASMFCIMLSIIGDIIDGPVARKYSKRRNLGGSLDLMSDTISFALAPALMTFVMFGRMGEATPVWTVLIAISCCWVIICGMLRLARFDFESGSDYNYFTGIASPTNAMLIISACGIIWLQPVSGFGPELTSWDCSFCFGKGEPKPWGDFLLVPLLLASGYLMVSDRKTSKLKHGIPLKLAILQMLSLLFAIIISMYITAGEDYASDLENVLIPFSLFSLSLLLVFVYIIGGEKFISPSRRDEGE